MKHISRGAALLVFLAHTTGLAAAGQSGCQELVDLQLPDVRIDRALAVRPDGEDDATKPHCKVDGVIGTEIRFELLLPDEWNGRFAMGGGGGYVGSVQNAARWTVDLGYATVGTDTGHEGEGISAAWALDHPERQVNFGHLAVHRTAEVAKAVVRSYYGSNPEYSYFMGCSRGGGQALMEAQRYPTDFDGLVAGAPAFDWTGIAAEFVQNMQKSFPDPSSTAAPIVSSAHLQLLENQVLESCDAIDGVRDGVMEDPRACAHNLSALPTCSTNPETDVCFTEEQLQAVEEIYAPPTTEDGPLYVGQPFGGEGHVEGWKNWITGIYEDVFDGTDGAVPSLQWAFGTEFYKYLVFGDPDWDYTRYDFSSWEEDVAFTRSFMNATDPDLSALAAEGHKLILWHGWSDAALSALGSIAYYENVEAADPDLRQYFRMFLMPGVLHCGGGPGPDQVDWLTVITDWVEHDRAPERIIASKADADGQVVRTRPLCPYPQRAVYLGSGTTDDADNFVCRGP